MRQLLRALRNSLRICIDGMLKSLIAETGLFSSGMAALFRVRFQRERRSLEALALTCGAEYTASANDYGFERAFSRQLESKIRRDDAAIGLTTSGSSLNVLHGLKKARELGAITVAFTGGSGVKDLEGVRAKKFVDYVLAVPLDPTQKENVALIQAAHLAAGHFICDYVDEKITTFDQQQDVKS